MAQPPFPALTPSATDFTSGAALYIASAAAELPLATPVADAIRDGRYPQESADVAGYSAVTIAKESSTLTHDRAALVVADDLWRLPHIDRFNSNENFIFADGAAAVVLSRDVGYARLLSAATLTDPTLSGLHADVPSTRTPVDITARARAFMQTRMGIDEVHARLRAALTSTIDAALSLARVNLADVARLRATSAPATTSARSRILWTTTVAAAVMSFS